MNQRSVWLGLAVIVLVAAAGASAVALVVGLREEASDQGEAASQMADAAGPVQRRVLDAGGAEAGGEQHANRWVEQNNRALELLAQGRLEEAVELFAACHAAAPGDGVYGHNLAEALFRLASATHQQGDLDVALVHLERAASLSPEREELAMLLERWRREARIAEGDTFSPGNYFRVEYDGQRRDLLQRNQEILDFLEGGGRYPVGAYEDLRGFFQIDPVIESGERIRVVLYDRAEFDELTGLGDWAGGVFDGVIRVAVNDLDSERARWERILRHELVHAFVGEVGGKTVPGWLNEGLAQLLETRTPEVSLARGELVGGALFTLDQLQDSLASWADTRDISRAYAQSLVFVDFLRGQTSVDLTGLLRACEAGEVVGDDYRVEGVALSTYLADLASDLAGD